MAEGNKFDDIPQNAWNPRETPAYPLCSPADFQQTQMFVGTVGAYFSTSLFPNAQGMPLAMLCSGQKNGVTRQPVEPATNSTGRELTFPTKIFPIPSFGKASSIDLILSSDGRTDVAPGQLHSSG